MVLSVVGENEAEHGEKAILAPATAVLNRFAAA
jgi:hypothetical protein